MRTDGHDDAKSRFSQFCEHVYQVQRIDSAESPLQETGKWNSDTVFIFG
jgi:hypothetical protein